MGPCSSFNGAIAAGDRAQACSSSFGGDGYIAAVVDPACPASQPYRYVCGSDQGGAQFCCQHAGTAGDPACEVCPAKGCNSVLGKNGAGVCFADSTECQVNPNPSANGDAVNRCPALVSLNTEIGAVCQTWCEANPEECTRSMNTYCSQAQNAHLPACSCVVPWATDWGELSYGSLQKIVQANPKVQAQLDAQAGKGKTLDIGCAWPPCMTTDKGVMVPPSRTCPPIGNLCVNVIEDVHISDVIAGSVTVGECTQGGGSGGKKSSIGGGMEALPFGTQLQLWLTRNPIVIVVIIAAFTVLFGALAYLAFKGPSALQMAEAEMTLTELQRRRQAKLNDLTSTMLSSRNRAVHEAGVKLLQRRKKAATQVADRFRAQVALARKELKTVEPYVKKSTQAAMRAASLRAEIHQFEAQSRKLQSGLLAGLKRTIQAVST